MTESPQSSDNTDAADSDVSLTEAASTDDQSIVFFDGVCGLCNRTVNFLMARDRNGVLRFAPLQGETAARLVPAEVRSDLNTFVFSDRGQLFYRSTAMARILMKIGGFWKVAGVTMWLVPAPLRNLGYRGVAAIRYRLFGKSESCRMPTPDERARFLD